MYIHSIIIYLKPTQLYKSLTIIQFQNLQQTYQFQNIKKNLKPMSHLQRHFYADRNRQQQLHNQNKNNKENNLSFRNIAANNQHQSHITAQPKHTKVGNNQMKVDTSFRSLCHDDSRASFYTSTEDLQQEFNYVGSCFNHSNKLAQYQETISQRQYCKLCAAKLASLGYKLEKSENTVSRDISPSINRFRSKDQSRIMKTPADIFQSKIKQNSSTLLAPPPVKFSTIISQKNRTQSLENKYEETDKIIEEYIEMYAEKMDKIEELINDIRIKDTQYVNKLKAQNKSILQECQGREQFQVERSNYDLFGKSIFKDSSSLQVGKFKLPTDERIEKLSKIIKFLEQTSTIRDKSPSIKKIPLIKSINSTESNGNNQVNNTTKEIVLLKNSSSVSNLSSKSNFKKQKKSYENDERFGSQINQAKTFKHEELEIESSRFSSNSAIIRKKANQSNNSHNTKTQSSQFKRRTNPQKSPQSSGSCQDTPQSIKSKISSNSFVLPKAAAVTMFQKINVCESIDIMPEESLKQARMKELEQGQQEFVIEEGYLEQENIIDFEGENSSWQSSNRVMQSQSYVEKSDNNNNKSVSGGSRCRKSFNRYHNFNNQQ